MILTLAIEKAVIHILDRDSEEALLNEFEIDITEDILSFLEKHITKSLTDDEVRKAKFKEGRNIVREVCARVADDPSCFLEGSKEVARQLFKAMKTNSSISSTDLVICLYRDEEGYNIAILKMDYNTSFIHDVEVVDDRYRISIRKQDISLPGPGQKIQKCAFVKGSANGSGFDLVILDNQINNRNNDEPVAQFFLQTFLGAELIMDNKEYTKVFKKETENWIRNKSKEGETAAEEMRQFVNNVIREDDEVDITEFSHKVFKEKQYLYEDYVQCMKDKGLAEERFEVDKEWVDRRLNKIKLKTDGNIEVSLSYEDFTNREKFEIINNADGTRSIIIKNITSLMEK